MAIGGMKNTVTKVTLADSGDGSVTATISFQDGTEFSTNGDPCRCWDQPLGLDDEIEHYCYPAYEWNK